MVDKVSQSLFKDIQARAFRSGVAPNTQEASKWFFEKIGNMRAGRINRNQLLKDSALHRRGQTLIGRMYFFAYDAKHKDTLPYWDAFPLVIMVGPAEGGFYGLNLHYLPPLHRMQLFEELMKITNNKSYDETTKFRMSYQLLQGSRKYRAFAPCFKHYLSKQMLSKPSLVDAPEWEIATLLPVHRFKGAKATKVWNDSKRAIRNNR